LPGGKKGEKRKEFDNPIFTLLHPRPKKQSSRLFPHQQRCRGEKKGSGKGRLPLKDRRREGKNQKEQHPAGFQEGIRKKVLKKGEPREKNPVRNMGGWDDLGKWLPRGGNRRLQERVGTGRGKRNKRERWRRESQGKKKTTEGGRD